MKLQGEQGESVKNAMSKNSFMALSARLLHRIRVDECERSWQRSLSKSDGEQRCDETGHLQDPRKYAAAIAFRCRLGDFFLYRHECKQLDVDNSLDRQSKHVGQRRAGLLRGTRAGRRTSKSRRLGAGGVPECWIRPSAETSFGRDFFDGQVPCMPRFQR